MPRIVIVDGHTMNPGDNSWDRLTEFGTLEVHDNTSPDQLLERAKDADVLITNKVPLSADTLEKLPNLKFIAVTATGYNVIDLEAARSRGIPVSNVPIYGTVSVGQFTWALILELCHHVGLHSESVKAGDWAGCPDFCYWKTPLIELDGKRLGLVGFGRISRRVAQIGAAFGMEVSASDLPIARTADAPVPWKSNEELFAESDIVSLHCPLTPETDQMVNRALLDRMQPSAMLINASRGALVNEQDLADALNNERIAGAAVDVVSVEPIQPDNPLLTARNCLITPHIAWAALAPRQRIMQTTHENLAAFFAGKPQNDVT